MGFGNARHGCKSTEEHECEDDDSLHLDLIPFSLIAWEGDNPLVEAGGIKTSQERAGLRHEGQPDCHRDARVGSV
jgi:hypothetical protein